MREVEENVERRTVIEAYAGYEFAKKRPDCSLPNFDEWDWFSADRIDERLCQSGLKKGIPAGFLLWKK